MLSRLGSPTHPWETVLTLFIAHLPSTQKYSASEMISSCRRVTTEKCYSLLYYRLCFICLWIYVFVCSVKCSSEKKKWGEISSFRWPWNTVWVEGLILLYRFQLKLFFCCCCCSQVFTCWCSQWSPNVFFFLQCNA